LFNLLVGNCDAHGKNIAFLYAPKCELAPFYDLISTQCYETLSQKFSMKIGGENRLDWIQKRHLQIFSESIGVKFTLVLKEFNKLVALIEQHQSLLESYLPLKKVVNHNVQKFSRRLEV